MYERRHIPVKRFGHGFTLVELVVVVAIIGIIAGIAYPNYLAYLTRANRAAVKQFMLDIASREEQYMIDQRSYTQTIGTGGLQITIPAETVGKYTVTVTTAGTATCPLPAGVVPSFCIEATAQGSQTSDGNLTLDSTGAKLPASKWSK